MSDITLIDDSEQSSLVTNGLAKNGELYLKKAGSTDAGSIVVYDSGVWKGFANEYSAGFANAYSVDFDGSNDFVSTGYAPGSSSGFSISMWIKSTNVSQNMSFASNGTSAGSPGGFQAMSVGRPTGTQSYVNSFYMLVKNSGGSTSVNNSVGGYNARADVCDGNWHHLCFTVSGTSVKIYKDGGDAAGSGNTQGTPFATWTSAVSYDGNTGNPYFLGRNGAYTAAANYWMDGHQDEVAMFEYELSGSQVSDIYNSGVPNNISSLSPTLWYRMGDDDSGTGTTITDQGSGGNDGTLTNGPTFSSDVPS